MGGNAMGGRRIHKEEYPSLLKTVKDAVLGYYGLDAVEIPYYSNKESFGDLDIIIPKEWDGKFAGFLDYMNIPSFHINDGVLSIAIDGCQVDFMYVSPSMVETTRNFLAWNDCGMLIGLYAKSMGFSFGNFGLKAYAPRTYPNLIVSKDMDEILTFLGLDYSRWAKGFDDLEDIFQFITDGKYFNKSLFSLDAMNSTNRSRNRKRPNYNSFVEYAKSIEDKAVPKRYSLEEALDAFDTSEAKQSKLLKSEVDRHIRMIEVANSKVNGHAVMSKLGIDQKSLGPIMDKYRKYRSIEYLQMASPMEAWRHFMDIYLYL